MSMWMLRRIWLVAPMLFCATPAWPLCAGLERITAAGGGRQTRACASDHIHVPEGNGKAYRIGPGQDYTKIGDVPWHALAAGDTVYIHYRAEPYREKILISGRGTPEQWIRIIGVPGPNGERPVISGDEAVTSENMHYRWTKPDVIQWLGVVQVVVSSEVDDLIDRLPPAYIEIANLRIQDGSKSLY